MFLIRIMFGVLHILERITANFISFGNFPIGFNSARGRIYVQLVDSYFWKFVKNSHEK